jgi:hypothetical protein
MEIEANSTPKPALTRAVIADDKIVQTNEPLIPVPAAQEGENMAKQDESKETGQKTIELHIDQVLSNQKIAEQAKSLRLNSQIEKALDKAMGPGTPTGQHPQSGTHGDLRCPNCHLAHRAGELACLGCGVVFSSTAATHKFGSPTDLKVERVRYVGEAVTSDMQAITFRIDGEHVTIPVCSSLIVGRSGSPTDPPTVRPDVDLNRFQAHLNGVSRQHIRISRERDLVHITDLGTTNGTYLNGFRLMPHQKRLLRNGDEVLLGRLKVRVQF